MVEELEAIREALKDEVVQGLSENGLHGSWGARLTSPVASLFIGLFLGLLGASSVKFFFDLPAWLSR